MDGVNFGELEMFMAETVKREAAESVQEFIQEISQDGITPEEVDEVRQRVLTALADPSYFGELMQYLVASNLMDAEDAPAEYDVGFVLSLLGLVGVAQELVEAG
jgi:phage shock protein A